MKKILCLMLLPFSLFFIACGSDESSSESSAEFKPIYDSQPVIQVDTKSVITVDGKQFKDLSGDGKLDKYEDWRLSPTTRAKDLAGRMTLEQKIGLLLHGSPGNPTFNSTTGEAEVSTGTQSNIAAKHIRFGVARVSDSYTAKQYAEYFNAVQKFCEGTDWGIPFVISLDPSHGIDGTINATGLFSNWPMPEGLGAINDPVVTRRFGQAINQEYRAIGVRLQLGPMADVASEPRWSRVQNCIAEDFDIVGNNIGPFVKGMQDGDRVASTSVAAVIKHFPGAGPDDDGMDSHTAPGQHNLYLGNQLAKHVAVFQHAFDAGIQAMMPCYSIFLNQFDENVCAAMNKEIINLAKSMGFNGFVISDWGVIGTRAWGLTDQPRNKQVEIFLKAGSHQNGGSTDPNVFLNALNDVDTSGNPSECDVTEDMITAAATKALELIFSLGVFENPYVDDTDPGAVATANETVALEAQVKATVLLQNVAGTLPLSKSPAAETRVFYLGRATDSYAQAVNYTSGMTNVTVVEPSVVNTTGITDIATYNTAYATIRAENVAKLINSDVAVIRITARPGIYFGIDVGIPLSFDGVSGSASDSTLETAFVSGWGGTSLSRGSEEELDKVKMAIEAKETNTDLKIIVVMYAVRPGIPEPFIDDIDGFFVDFGATDGALLSLIFGDNSPTGKLPMELPSSDANVRVSFEDVPNDTNIPCFEFQDGLNY